MEEKSVSITTVTAVTLLLHTAWGPWMDRGDDKLLFWGGSGFSAGGMEFTSQHLCVFW